MSDRTPYIVGNWKMNLGRQEAFELAEALRDGVGELGRVDVGVAPAFVYLELVAQTLSKSGVAVGGQDCAPKASGALTGQVSAGMQLDVGCGFTVVGHSERRHDCGESDELVGTKLRAALEAGLEVILCVGELLEERDGGRTEAVVRRQLQAGLEGVTPEQMAKVTLAYEPVWAIGTGRTASPEQASEVHIYLRGLLAGLYDERIAESVRIQYGGSVKPDNAAELLSAPGVDGALVGGASLTSDSFLAIVDAARARH
ncbi:MAG: triose-phosphate isomerase [Planctomycetota bacterium]